MFEALISFLPAASPGLVALLIGLLLARRAWLVNLRYLLPILGLAVCNSGFALVEYIYGGWTDIRIPLAFSVPLAAGLLARNRPLVMFGSLILWAVSVPLNAPLVVNIDPYPGATWTVLGYLISSAGFFLVLTAFVWYCWGRQARQEQLRGTTNRNES